MDKQEKINFLLAQFKFMGAVAWEVAEEQRRLNYMPDKEFESEFEFYSSPQEEEFTFKKAA